MAYIATRYCYICCKDTLHTNGKCNICKENEYKESHRKFFADLDSMTLEERVRRLEKIDWEIRNNPPSEYN